MHAKTDSEVTSLSASSPGRSPRRPAYYVQSPSHDDKTATSIHSSPSASPRHSSNYSSSTRFSASLKHHHSKVSPATHKEVHAIEEEVLLDDDERSDSLPRRYYFLGFLLAFVLLFSFFALVLWGASRSQKPTIDMKTVTFSILNVQAALDDTGVPTDMSDVNSTVAFSFRNTATFFGLHVTSTLLDLRYSEITIATGSMGYFYQGRKSQRNLKVVVKGSQVPLYGSGSYLSTSPPGTAVKKPPVPLNLRFTVRSRAYILGRLVKPKFYIDVYCTIPLDLAKLTKPIPLKNNCQFD